MLEAEVESSASCSVEVGSDEVDAAAATSKPDCLTDAMVEGGLDTAESTSLHFSNFRRRALLS